MYQYQVYFTQKDGSAGYEIVVASNCYKAMEEVKKMGKCFSIKRAVKHSNKIF